MKAIYLRVSKKELDENTQLPTILKTFNLKAKDCVIYQERISAYEDTKQEQRTEFIKLRKAIENREVNQVYVYSLERFERNIKRMLEFYFFCEINDCKLYSALQFYLNNLLPKNVDKMLRVNPIYEFLMYLMVLIYGFVAQNESWLIGERTRKSAQVIQNVTYSKDGNKWGRQFKGTTDNPNVNEKGNVKITPDELAELHKYIKNKLKQLKQANTPYLADRLVEAIAKAKKIQLSKPYLYKHFEI